MFLCDCAEVSANRGDGDADEGNAGKVEALKKWEKVRGRRGESVDTVSR